jgi:E3 ubiquitin-protein ligase CCNP1IP1
MTQARDDLQRKNDELAGAYQDKSRKLFQTQELYNKVKKRAELSQIERAAIDAVDNSTRSVPQPAVNNQAFNILRSHHFQDDNERNFPLSRGLRFDATEFTTAPPGLNPQEYENESRWPRKRPQFHGEICHTCSFHLD